MAAVNQFFTTFNQLEITVNTDQNFTDFETNNQNKMQARALAEQGGQTDIKFGTEFTFTNDEISQSRVSYVDNNARQNAPLEEKNANTKADQKVLEWKNAIVEKYSSKPVNGLTVIVSLQEVKGEDAYKITYKDNEDKEVWWFVISRDDGCLETQTQPMSIQDANTYRNVIEKDIFEFAKVGLKVNSGKKPKGKKKDSTGEAQYGTPFAAHDEIGGGHLSIDATTTFGDNGRLFRNFIVRYVNQMAQMNTYDNDRENAPNIAELPMPFRTAFRDIINDYDRAFNDPVTPDMTMDELAARIQDEVYRWTLRTDQAGPTPEKTHEHELHYQAINLEHLTDNDPAKRRVEMRRFRAQTGFQNLLEQLNMLQTLRNDSRTKVGWVQQTEGLEPLDEDSLLEDSVVDDVEAHSVDPDPDQRPENMRNLHTRR